MKPFVCSETVETWTKNTERLVKSRKRLTVWYFNTVSTQGLPENVHYNKITFYEVSQSGPII